MRRKSRITTTGSPPSVRRLGGQLARVGGVQDRSYDRDVGFVDPARYRGRLDLLASLSDDGLEDLILRLVQPDYPAAHRTGPGRDGGIDVLSDLNNPPERGCRRRTMRPRTSRGPSAVTR